jgi:hypothetical protein
MLAAAMAVAIADGDDADKIAATLGLIMEAHPSDADED